MIPSAPRRSPCPCCRRRRRNVAAGRPPLVGSSVTARALAAGLWRLRQAERSAADAARRQDNPPSLVGGRKAKPPGDFGIGRKQSCRSHGNGNGILDKIEAACCVVDCSCSYSYCGSMEKATKWDYVNNSNKHLVKKEIGRRLVVAMELEKARARIDEAEEEERLVSRKLRKVLEEKAWWKSKARCTAAALREERHHRREVEGANGKLMKEVATARQRVETERKARELMEEACEELSKEVEEDQAEVEALRRECVAMREEMEEERRMLQMAEVWREERVQMKLSDAKAVLEHKYAHLNTLQSEMESFLLRHGHRAHLRRTVNMLATSVRGANGDDDLFPPANTYKSPHAPEDVDKVFDHFRRNHTDTTRRSSSSVSVASPATDLFLEKLDDDGGWPWERETPPPPPPLPPPHPDRTIINSNSNSNCNAAAAAAACNSKNNGGSGVTDESWSGRSRRSGNFNTALIRRLWRSAISESRRKTAAAAASASASSSGRNRVFSPSYSDKDRDRDRDTARSSVVDQGSQGGSAAAAKEKEKEKEMTRKKKKSLMEKLMEARMDDHHTTTDKP